MPDAAAFVRQPVSARAPMRGMSENRRAMIAEPDPGARMAIRSTLGEFGITQISEASDGGDVIGRLKLRHHDIIICAYKLDPRRDGQRLLEELRGSGTLPLSTMFVLAIDSGVSGDVIACADFEPDDLIVKPFTGAQLGQRLRRVLDKQRCFHEVYRAVNEAKTADAADECLRLATDTPRFAGSAYRLGVRLLIDSGRLADARRLLEQLIAVRPAPWSLLALARVHARDGRDDEAEALLEPLVIDHPRLLAAYDELAAVKERLGKHEAALDVLDSATRLSARNAARLRQSARLCEATGKAERAEQLYSQLVARVEHSALEKAEDYNAFTRVLLAQGKFDEANQVIARRPAGVGEQADGEFMAALLGYRRAFAAGDHAATEGAFDLLDDLHRRKGARLSPGLVLEYAQIALDREQTDFARIALADLLERETADPVTRQRARTLYEALPAPAAVPTAANDTPHQLTFEQIDDAFRKLDDKHDEALAKAIERSLLQWAERVDMAVQVTAARDRLARHRKRLQTTAD
ncbi:tetratricopeptide repeat protein [Derxia gummosa]|uniref:Tetratricopeptide repeat protein n=1 Tax=Derxia gummosa DSM 723 TaxID=1121388 RepID=A0A8B6X0W7_9BURK|nr:tetratricopeptide repeat protein [Derxia gummosa]